MRVFFWLSLVVSTVVGYSGGQAKDSAANTKQLVIYTSRAEHLLKPLLDKYTATHGVKFRYMKGKAAALVQKLLTEGKNTQADLLITVDAGNLWFAAQNKLLVPLKSQVLEKAVPSHLRAADMSWVGLSVRARPIVYSSKQVQAKQLSSYEDLANKQWKGKLCLRTAKKVYNRSLVAMLLEMHGAKKTETLLKGWVSNLAAPVFSSDTKVIEAIKAGQCALGIVNTYYLGRLLKKDPSYPVRIFLAEPRHLRCARQHLWSRYCAPFQELCRGTGLYRMVESGRGTAHVRRPQSRIPCQQQDSTPCYRQGLG